MRARLFFWWNQLKLCFDTFVWKRKRRIWVSFFDSIHFMLEYFSVLNLHILCGGWS